MAEDTDQDQKTEEPTEKRLSQAREEEGRLPISREITTWALFVGFLMGLAWLVPSAVRDIALPLRAFLEKPEQMSLDDNGLQNVLGGISVSIGWPAGLLFALLMGAVLVAGVAQTGFFLNSARLKPDWSQVLPWSGFKRLFSTNAIAEFVKSLVKLVIIGGVVLMVFLPLINLMPSYVGRDMGHSLAFLHHESVRLLALMVLIITVMAVGDLLYQRYQYFKSLRMTKQEVKEEYRQAEGDPIIKSRLRQIRMDKARKRMMAQVPKADVIITNPTHYAIALKYDGVTMNAPVVVAKGTDALALRIRTVAEEHNVPLISNPPLARTLYETVDVDSPIKPEQYRVVAEIIAYVYKLKKRLKPG